MNTYIFLVRRARINKKSQYVGLIPKLFSNLYNNNTLLVKNIFNRETLKHRDYYDIFTDILLDESNLLNRSKYISESDKLKIIRINRELFLLEKWNRKKFINFIEHLYRGHSDMEYGLYFGILKADNYLDFLSKIKKSNIKNIDQRIIYYSEINNFLNKIDIYQEKFKNNLLYFNKSWKYGIKEYENGSMNYISTNRYHFLSHINSFNNEILMNSELICNIPLSVENFKFIFGKF